MIFIPNILSLLRIPLVLVFLQDDPVYRCIAIALALLTDMLDGFIARRYNLTSQLGAILDAVTDKFFVLCVLAILFQEDRIGLGGLLAMISRDLSVFFYGCYLKWMGRLSEYRVRAIWSGKAATFLQLTLMFGVTYGLEMPASLYWILGIIGLSAFAELYLRDAPFRLLKS